MPVGVTNPAEPIDLESIHTPSNYVCSQCGDGGVKLWRESGEFILSPDTLHCADCAAAETSTNIWNMNDEGVRRGPEGLTDQIGRFLPAVPFATNDGYYDYCQIAEDPARWWRGLPVR